MSSFQVKYSNLKASSGRITQSTADANSKGAIEHPRHQTIFRERSITKHFAELRDENRRLYGERERLRELLRDREDDVKIIRGELSKEKSLRFERDEEKRQKEERTAEVDVLVKRLEGLQVKYSTLKQDLQVQNSNFSLLELFHLNNFFLKLVL